MQTPIIDYFEPLSADEIYQEPSGKWSDSDLLNVLQLFSEENDKERETAVLELILSSPDNAQMVAYDELYFDIIHDIYLNQGEFDKATYWAIAALAYEIQHFNDTVTVQNLQRSLVEIYLRQENIDPAIQLSTRLLQIDPSDLWTHNTLALFSAKLPKELVIATLERALVLAKDNDPDELQQQLQEFYEGQVKAKETDVSPSPEINPNTLTQFYEALSLPPLSASEEPKPYLAPITELFNQEEHLDTELQQKIIEQWQVLIPELLQVAFDKTYWGTAVNQHAILILRQIHGKEPALHALTHWLEQTTDENWHLLLSDYTCKIGGFTTSELKKIISNINLDTFVRSSAAEALAKRLETIPEQQEEIINYFRHLLTREEAYEASEEMFIALLIAAIIDEDAKELYPEIKQVFDEDRINPTVTDLADLHEQWDMSPLPSEQDRKDGIYAILECKKCQRTRIHFVKHVTTDMITLNAQLEGKNVPYDPHIMDRPIICPKCGAVDQYKTDPMTSMRLAVGNNMENMLAGLLGEKPKEIKPDPFVTQVNPQAFGQNMHPFVALDRYRQMALSNPKDAEPHWRIGNILRMIWRDEQAKEAYEKSIRLNPDELFALYSLAATEHDLGNQARAKELYEETMRRISPVAMLRDSELMDISLSAAEGLKALEQGLPSVYAQDMRYPDAEPKKLSRKERRAQKKKTRKLKKKKRR